VLKRFKTGFLKFSHGVPMVIRREEMQEIAKKYKEPIGLNLGSHSALDAWQGQRNYGLRSIIYTTPGRARIYLQNPMVGKPDEPVEDLPSLVRRDIRVVNDPKDIKKNGDWKSVILILDKYSDIVKYVDELVDLECLQIPNRAFSVYVGGDEYCSVIENQFAVPIVGSRTLLKIENRGEIEKDYYWFAEQAGIPYPKSYKFEVRKGGIRFKEFIDEPMLLKAEHAHRKFEREFIFAADSKDLEEKVEREVKAGNLNEESLRNARVEQIVLGPHANFNFFFSPLDAKSDWGDVDDWFSKLYNVTIEEARICLANQFLSIDERRETILDGVKRLPLEVQQKLKRVPSFEVTAHAMLSLRESLLKDVQRYADRFLLACREHEPPGIIGAWCLQTLITWDRISKYELKPTIKLDYTSGIEAKTAADYGLYDVPEAKDPYMHIPVTQDVALRHGGGTNVHMGIGSQYANAKYKKPMSTGDRIALEIRRAWKTKQLHEIVT
jgi:5-formaminoimidazole-4-carboxamide-1-(beta)-D-ribofuranosyl 5'-monophosphate synthetase